MLEDDVGRGQQRSRDLDLFDAGSPLQSLQSAQDIQAGMIDAVLESLRKKLITVEEAEKRIMDINETFQKAVDGAWKTELIDTALAALKGFKDTPKGLAGPFGEMADALASAAGKFLFGS